MSPAGRDPAGWLLALAVRSLPPARRPWGEAMRAELASIEPGTPRWRFALGCLRVVLWQGPVWRVAGCLAMQGAVLVLVLRSAIGGLFGAEVIALVLLAPPVLWWIGRPAARFAPGPRRGARVGRRVGYGLVAACVAVAVGFIAAEIAHRPEGYGASAFWLGFVVLALAVHARDVLVVTSAQSTVSSAAMTSGAGFGAGAGLAVYLLLPYGQSLAVHGTWLAAAYAAALAAALVGAPAAAGLRTARADRSLRAGLHAGGCAGVVAAMLLFIVGVGSVWLWPELVDSSIFDKGPRWLPGETRELAGTYVIALVLVPPLGLVFGALGAAIGAAAGGSGRVDRARAVLALAVLVVASALCYPLTHLFDGLDATRFGDVGATAVAFSADGRALVTANGEQTAILWSLADAKRPVRSATFFGAAAFAPDGRTLATRGLLWNVADPAHPTRIAAFDDGDPAVFSPDGRRLATVDNGVRMLWDVTDHRHPRRMASFTGDADAFSPDGRTLATRGSCTTESAAFGVGCATTLWSVSDRTPPRRIATIGGASAVFAPDGRTLATRAVHDTVILWSLAEVGHPIRLATLVAGGDERPPPAVVYSPDGRLLATGSEDGTVKLWPLDDPAHPSTMPSAHPLAYNAQIGVSDTHTVAAFSPDGRTLAAIMGNSVITRWDVTDPRRPARSAVLRRRTYGAGLVAFSRDAAAVAGAAIDGGNSVTVWRTG